ncbi:MAG: hypothetical protein NTW21_17555 [Verrucomicrobia bacterium]|nr:hypothetical protein [Verrucomicrobiota bacterium]
MNTAKLARAFAILLIATASALHAQVPQLINYQGRVAVSGTNFDGTGQFKFALVDGDGGTSYWSNDGTSTAGSQPTSAVSLPVTKGLYLVLLGDATLANMTIVPATVFTNPDVRLRVWFNDGSHDWQQLTPDQRIAAVGYALMAATVPDGAITAGKLATGSVTAAAIATGAVGAGHLASNSITAANIASNEVVKSINSFKDDVTISAGSNITVSPSGNSIQISASLPTFSPIPNMQVFDTYGTFTVPAGVTRIMVDVWGGGGGGGWSYSKGGAGGGGAGGYGRSLFTVHEGEEYAVTIGGGGISYGNGSNGTNSSFGTIITANGGIGALATWADASTQGAEGGTANADVALTGGSGSNGENGAISAPRYGSGGSGGSAAAGGAGGRGGWQSSGISGRPGSIPGGGGGGGSGGTASPANEGGAGARGRVIVYW